MKRCRRISRDQRAAVPQAGAPSAPEQAVLLLTASPDEPLELTLPEGVTPSPTLVALQENFRDLQVQFRAACKTGQQTAAALLSNQKLRTLGQWATELSKHPVSSAEDPITKHKDWPLVRRAFSRLELFPEARQAVIEDLRGSLGEPVEEN
jgi:hypothetical protein